MVEYCACYVEPALSDATRANVDPENLRRCKIAAKNWDAARTHLTITQFNALAQRQR